MSRIKYFFLGLGLGMVVMAAAVAGLTAVRRVLFWGGELEPGAKARRIVELLERHSIFEIERGALLDGMYQGLIGGLGDPYAQYLDERDLAGFVVDTEGRYAGIGVTVTGDEHGLGATVVTVFAGSPADRAGILPDDRIVAVDGADVAEWQLEAITDVTKGAPGSAVVLTIYRPSEDARLDLVIERAYIVIPSVFYEAMECGLGYVRLARFDRATVEPFGEAVASLQAGGMEGLVIDLRDNPGGVLDVVIQIADALLPEGIITYTEDAQGKRADFHSDAGHVGVPMAILINGNSASASEVLSGAARDLTGAVLVGTQTFGKAVVQQIFYLGDGTAIKITSSQYFTPHGYSLGGTGLIPDHAVEAHPEWRPGELPFDEDPQWQAAAQVLWETINEQSGAKARLYGEP